MDTCFRGPVSSFSYSTLYIAWCHSTLATRMHQDHSDRTMVEFQSRWLSWSCMLDLDTYQNAPFSIRLVWSFDALLYPSKAITTSLKGAHFFYIADTKAESTIHLHSESVDVNSPMDYILPLHRRRWETSHFWHDGLVKSIQLVPTETYKYLLRLHKPTNTDYTYINSLDPWLLIIIVVHSNNE